MPLKSMSSDFYWSSTPEHGSPEVVDMSNVTPWNKMPFPFPAAIIWCDVPLNIPFCRIPNCAIN